MSDPVAEWARVERVASLDALETALVKRWDAAAATRIRTMNLVALCETHAHVERADRVLAHAAEAHGARTTRVDFVDAPSEGVRAAVALHPRADRPGPAGERIELEVEGGARRWLNDIVSRLLVPDLPTYVWWVGDLPDDDERFAQVARHSDLAVFDSADMDLRDLPVLTRFAEREKCACAVSDLGWARIRVWQDMIARFFDEPSALVELSTLRQLEISFKPRRNDPEPVSNQAALLAGWLAARLGYAFGHWARVGQIDEAHLHGPSGELHIRFLLDDTQYAVDRRIPRNIDGAIGRVTLSTKHARYTVSRPPEDANVLCWSAEVPGGNFPTQCVRVESPAESDSLVRLLGRPTSDPLLIASLRRASEIVEKIAPKPKLPRPS